MSACFQVQTHASLCRGEVTETDGSRDLGREAYGRELYQDVKDLLGFWRSGVKTSWDLWPKGMIQRSTSPNKWNWFDWITGIMWEEYGGTRDQRSPHSQCLWPGKLPPKLSTPRSITCLGDTQAIFKVKLQWISKVHLRRGGNRRGGVNCFHLQHLNFSFLKETEEGKNSYVHFL